MIVSGNRWNFNVYDFALYRNIIKWSLSSDRSSITTSQRHQTRLSRISEPVDLRGRFAELRHRQNVRSKVFRHRSHVSSKWLELLISLDMQGKNAQTHRSTPLMNDAVSVWSSNREIPARGKWKSINERGQRFRQKWVIFIRASQNSLTYVSFYGFNQSVFCPEKDQREK